jgi:hypothetical protein
LDLLVDFLDDLEGLLELVFPADLETTFFDDDLVFAFLDPELGFFLEECFEVLDLPRFSAFASFFDFDLAGDFYFLGTSYSVYFI